MRLGSADGYRARRLGAAVLALGAGALSWGMYAAGPASAAAGRGSLGLAPASGPAGSSFTAAFHISGSTNCNGSVDFTFDNVPVMSAGLDASCSAGVSIAVPPGTPNGAHRVHAASSTGASAGATFTVTDGGQPPPTTQPTGGPPPGGGTTPPGQPATSSSITSQLVSFFNYTTPTTPWTAPPFVPQPIPGVTAGPCDTTGPHATSLAGSFLSIPAYSVGTHTNGAAGGGIVSEPGSGALPILNVGPPSMLPPQLGVTPYQPLELLEPIDPNVSPKLRLAAAAGEPFACLQVETFGAQGSGYGYLVYALKGALVVSVQDANADGSPFVQALPSVAAVPTPVASSSSKAGAKKPSATTPTPTPAAPKAKFERVKLGYTSIQWEYQDAGGANAPAHRGTGTITPPPPQSPLSYSNLVFAFGGLVAATVALMFAYHSRRRDLDRRARGRRAARHV